MGWEKQFHCVAAAILLSAALPAAGALHAAGAGTYAKIDAALASGDAVRTTAAVRQIAHLLRQGTHYDCPTRLRYGWLPTLMAQKDYAAAAKLSRLAIVLNPGQTSNMANFQAFRVSALLAMGKTHAALRNAKSLFDVIAMRRTATAAVLVAQCLRAQGADGAAQQAAFEHEEIAGEAPPVAGHARNSAILAGIHVNDQPYLRAIREQSDYTVAGLVAKGNLWLLAGKPAKARQCFDDAYDMAGTNMLAMISERIASSIRAQDGTIGAANAWARSIAK